MKGFLIDPGVQGTATMAQGPESAICAFRGRQDGVALAQRLPFGMGQDFDDGTVEQRTVIQQLPVGGAPALRHRAVGGDIQMRPVAAPGIAAAKRQRMVDDVVGQGLEGAAMGIAFPVLPPDRKDRAQEINRLVFVQPLRRIFSWRINSGFLFPINQAKF